MKDWDNIEDLDSYEVEKGEHGFTGKLIDKTKKTINVLGMPADDIGFSYDEETTSKITQRQFNEVMRVKLRNLMF